MMIVFNLLLVSIVKSKILSLEEAESFLTKGRFNLQNIRTLATELCIQNWPAYKLVI